MAATSSQLVFQFKTKEELSLLIQLKYALHWIDRYYQKNWDGSIRKIKSSKDGPDDPLEDMKRVIRQLGFSEEISQKLYDDVEYRNISLQHLERQLEEWKRTPIYHFEIPVLQVDEKDVYSALRDGVMNLRANIVLSNPFIVWNLEKKFRMAETGDKQLFIQNWSKRHYTSKCLDYNNPVECFYLAVQDGDLAGVKLLYPDVMEDLDAEKLIKVITNSEKNIADVLQYLIEEGIIPARLYRTLFRRILRSLNVTGAESREENAIFLFKFLTIDTNILNRLFRDIVYSKYYNLIKLVLETRKDLSQEVIDNAFLHNVEHMVYDRAYDRMELFKDRLSSNFDFGPIVDNFYEKHNMSAIKVLYNTFNIPDEQIDDEIWKKLNRLVDRPYPY